MKNQKMCSDSIKNENDNSIYTFHQIDFDWVVLCRLLNPLFFDLVPGHKYEHSIIVFLKLTF